jgi:hypothetical protein
MNFSDMQFPRQLEADYDAETIRRVLTKRTVRLWSGGDLHVPLIEMADHLKKVLERAMAKGHIRCGFEEIAERLKNERAGIEHVEKRRGITHGDRVSRLILFSNDGAERLYRHIEQLLRSHSPRLLGCLLDIDSSAFGELMTGRARQIKVVMAEHKDTVSEALRAVLAGRPEA